MNRSEGVKICGFRGLAAAAALASERSLMLTKLVRKNISNVVCGERLIGIERQTLLP